jgi:hypothetical protein
MERTVKGKWEKIGKLVNFGLLWFVILIFREDDKPQRQPKYDFSELKQQLEQIIEEFDEKVFVKLNWSAPRDANWIVPNLW